MRPKTEIPKGQRVRTSVHACLGRLSAVGISAVIFVSMARGAEDSDAALAMTRARQWTQNHLLDAQAHVPFSFVYDRQPSARLLLSWPRKIVDTRLDAERTQHIISWTDGKTGLQVKCVVVEFADYPVLEWTVF